MGGLAAGSNVGTGKQGGGTSVVKGVRSAVFFSWANPEGEEE